MHEGLGTYAGITWSDKHIYIAYRDEGGKCVPSDKEGILVLDKKWNEVRRYAKPDYDFNDLHQIYYHDSRLFVANTAMDKIDLINTESHTMEKELPCPLGEKKTHHLNSVFFGEGHYWICMHNRGESDVIKLRPGSFEEVDRIRIGNQIHNAYVENGRLYTLSSLNSSVLSTDIHKHKRVKRVKKLNTSMWLRGLARTESNWIIGMTTFEAERSKRVGAPSYIIIFNDSFRKKKIVDTTVSGLIYDLRATAGDRAHNSL
ncbi:MAG: hypothetical protein A2176_11685 [Spirochaetes bacterium RBG_13_51_14]|nr:MAG: hypothetical protein A2176_11685 [Spirochaetes bacterium RBG_13_51_14]